MGSLRCLWALSRFGHVLLTAFQTPHAQVKSPPGPYKLLPFLRQCEADGWQCEGWIPLITENNHSLEMLQCVPQSESSLADNKTSTECKIIQWEWRGGGNGKKPPVLRGFTVCAPDKNHNMGSAFFSACSAFGMRNQALAGRANFLLPGSLKKRPFPHLKSGREVGMERGAEPGSRLALPMLLCELAEPWLSHPHGSPQR